MKHKKKISSLLVGEICEAGNPCEHQITITYKDGREETKALKHPKFLKSISLSKCRY